jgi:hypothetical protein
MYTVGETMSEIIAPLTRRCIHSFLKQLLGASILFLQVVSKCLSTCTGLHPADVTAQ